MSDIKISPQWEVEGERLHLCHRLKPYLTVQSENGDFVIRASWEGEVRSVWEGENLISTRIKSFFDRIETSPKEFLRILRPVLSEIEPWRRRRRGKNSRNGRVRSETSSGQQIGNLY